MAIVTLGQFSKYLCSQYSGSLALV